MSDPIRITDEARRAAAIAVAVEVNGWPIDAGLPYHPADNTTSDTLQRIVDVVLGAALPHLIDRDALAQAAHHRFCLVRHEATHAPDKLDYDKADEILEILALIGSTTP